MGLSENFSCTKYFKTNGEYVEYTPLQLETTTTHTKVVWKPYNVS